MDVMGMYLTSREYTAGLPQWSTCRGVTSLVAMCVFIRSSHQACMEGIRGRGHSNITHKCLWPNVASDWLVTS